MVEGGMGVAMAVLEVGTMVVKVATQVGLAEMDGYEGTKLLTPNSVCQGIGLPGTSTQGCRESANSPRKSDCLGLGVPTCPVCRMLLLQLAFPAPARC